MLKPNFEEADGLGISDTVSLTNKNVKYITDQQQQQSCTLVIY